MMHAPHCFASLAVVALGLATVPVAPRAPLTAVALAPARDDPRVQAFPDLGLTLNLPPLEELKPVRMNDPLGEGAWSGKLGSLGVEISLLFFPKAKFDVGEPAELTELIESDLRAVRSDRRLAYDFASKKTLNGPYGFAPYATLSRADTRDKNGTQVTGSLFLMCGLLENGAYAVRIDTQPACPDANAKTLLEFLDKGVVYKGTTRNNKWTDESARARWESTMDKKLHKKLEPFVRTTHYIIISDSPSAPDFAKHMEGFYDEIKKVYPFEEVPGRTLMPVFLFRTPDEYYDFYAKVHDVPLEQARRSKGHASGDYYATWYEAPRDEVHIHEATHQIFRNRLALSGGGSWFQEGVAEYISTAKNDRNIAARLVKKGQHVPLAEFVKLKSLLYSTSGDDVKSDEAGDNYKQAAVLIEFLRESKWGKAKFQDFLHAVGAVPRNDVPAIEGAVKSVYGTDLAGLEAQWIEYCKKR